MTCRRQRSFLSIQSYPSYPHWTLKSLENRMNILCLISFVLLLGRFHHGPSFIAWKWSSFSQSTMNFVSLQLEGLTTVFVWYNQQFFLLSTREIATGFIVIYLLHSVIPPIWTGKELLLKLLLLALSTRISIFVGSTQVLARVWRKKQSLLLWSLWLRWCFLPLLLPSFSSAPSLLLSKFSLWKIQHLFNFFFCTRNSLDYLYPMKGILSRRSGNCSRQPQNDASSARLGLAYPS